jgi:hypothetical protein
VYYKDSGENIRVGQVRLAGKLRFDRGARTPTR